VYEQATIRPCSPKSTSRPNWPLFWHGDGIVASVFLTLLPLRLRAVFTNVMVFSALQFRSENCIIFRGASPPRLSAIIRRAEDQLLAPLRWGFSFLPINSSYSPVAVTSPPILSRCAHRNLHRGPAAARSWFN